MSSITPDSEKLPSRRGVIAVVTRGDQFLVIRRSAMVLAPREFCFPGGGIEGDETEAEALVRELREELGVEIRPLCRVWQNITRWNVDLAWWRGEIRADVELIANPAEVESIHWLTVQEMLELKDLLESNRHFLQALAAGEIVLESWL
jgi:8-oxo-dGTP diphosphatase